jgi:protein SCO1/2
MRRALVSILLVCLVVIVACKSKPGQERYPFKGIVISIELRGHQALIKHQDVPGLMQGMTMPFNIRDEKVLEALKPGDILQATLVRQEYESWLEDIRVKGSDPEYTEDQPATSVTPHRPSPGETVPDFVFTDQNGKHLRFSQLHGAPVLLTFIYARCPLPDFCPRMNANLLAVAQQSKDSNLQLLSISFDPAHDTPTVMRSYARQWTEDLPAAQRARWHFVVPSQSALKDLLTFFAMQADPDQGWITHSLSTTLVDADGKVVHWYGGNQWTPDDVLQDLKTGH